MLLSTWDGLHRKGCSIAIVQLCFVKERLGGSVVINFFFKRKVLSSFMADHLVVQSLAEQQSHWKAHPRWLELICTAIIVVERFVGSKLGRMCHRFQEKKKAATTMSL